MTKFLYFAYGSNLLSKRIHINNPTAVRYAIGKLENYRLDFNMYSDRWRGAAATIVPTKNIHVWGAIWNIDVENMEDLDEQEGVHTNFYKPLEVQVKLQDGSLSTCRVYEQTSRPSHVKMKNLPRDRLPSALYLATIHTGAIESNLPGEYVTFLSKIPHNDAEASSDISCHLTDLK